MGTCPIFVVHKKGFPPWCHRKFTRCPGRTILCPTQASPHGIPKYHPLPNSRTLNDRWCPIGIQAKKELRKEYYTKWDSNEHLTAFGKRLDYNQRALVQSDVTIADDDKLQFYLEEIHDSNKFDKQEMLTWEQQTIRIKTDFDLTKAYFKAIVKATDVYEQNIGGGSTRGNNFESANQMADIGDELREWIQQIATTSANKEQAANTQATEKISSMEVQIMKLTATIPQMAANMNNENINPNTSSGDRES